MLPLRKYWMDKTIPYKLFPSQTMTALAAVFGRRQWWLMWNYGHWFLFAPGGHAHPPKPSRIAKPGSRCPPRILRKGLKDFKVMGGGNTHSCVNSPQDVGAQIVGGVGVNPPREYKVRSCVHLRNFISPYLNSYPQITVPWLCIADLVDSALTFIITITVTGPLQVGPASKFIFCCQTPSHCHNTESCKQQVYVYSYSYFLQIACLPSKNGGQNGIHCWRRAPI